jgi:hypothetical protein
VCETLTGHRLPRSASECSLWQQEAREIMKEEGEEEEAFFKTAHQAVQPNEDENRSPNDNASSEAPRLQGGYKMLPAQVQQHLCSQKGKIS